MAFKNEYVPPLEQEKSDFFRRARERLHTGYSAFDEWTVDREREMALTQERIRREIETADSDLWGFVDGGGYYVLQTERLSREEVPPDNLKIVYKYTGFWGGGKYSVPTAETIHCFKNALRERSKSYMFNLEAFKHCELTLIDGKTGEEI